VIGYRAVRGLARLVLGVFYRRIDVIGLANVPPAGPLVVVANHQNALIDPPLVMTAIPRHLSPVAKAPLFRHPLVAPFLWLVGAIPVHRRQDPGAELARNVATFAQSTRRLARGAGVLIFPEGVSQPEPALMPLRTGAARMVLEAERARPGLGVTLLPVGLVFHRPGTFRLARALVVIGAPLTTADLVVRAATAPEDAVRALTERIARELRALMLEAENQRMLELLHLAHAVWLAESAVRSDGATRLSWMQRALQAYRVLRVRDPARVERLREALERYEKELELVGLQSPALPSTYPPALVIRYALREGLSLIIGLPLAMAGLVLHWLPYRLTGWVVRLLRPQADLEATTKVLAALVLYPAVWAVEAWAARRLAGPLGLGLVLALLLPAGLFALTWRERLARVGRDTRGLLRFVWRRDLHERLLGRRRELRAELDELGRAAFDADDPPQAANPR
jgi:1-acyl-sn-glycerol-3-phosphate acyltransferase